MLKIVHTPSQEDFDRFASISGDDNPIHVDPGFAARTRFGKTVAHGMYLYAVLSRLGAELIRGRDTLQSNLMFPAPARVNEELRLEASADADVITLTATRTADGECVCRLTLMLAGDQP